MRLTGNINVDELRRKLTWLDSFEIQHLHKHRWLYSKRIRNLGRVNKKFWTWIKNFQIFRGGKFLKYHFELIHLSYSETETGANVAHGIGIHNLIISLFVIHPTWPAIWWESIWYRAHFNIWLIFFGRNWVNNRWSFANHSLKTIFKLKDHLEGF